MINAEPLSLFFPSRVRVRVRIRGRVTRWDPKGNGYFKQGNLSLFFLEFFKTSNRIKHLFPVLRGWALLSMVLRLTCFTRIATDGPPMAPRSKQFLLVGFLQKLGPFTEKC